jgi:8-oxo-dGTP diphosphatase
MAPSIQSISPGIRFFDPSNDAGITYTFAIIISRYNAQWIWVRHKERDTWELPAGHLEKGENAQEAAHRELYEETGALEYTIEPVVSYEGVFNGRAVFGKIFFAQVTKLGPLPDFEIREIKFYDQIPEKITYPEIQPIFFTYAQQFYNQLNPSSF